MKHEIKFRAWDIELKQFRTSLFIGQGGLLYFSDGGRIGTLETSQFIIQQYTEINDWHGEELCAGDIVKDCLTEAIYEIRFGFCKKYAFNGWYLFSPCMGMETPLTADRDTGTNSTLEKVGTTYDNPELLKPIEGEGI